MEYVRLLKLLYIADREMMAEAGAPVTGDRAVAMDHGPVLSHVYDLVKGKAARAREWAHLIRTTYHWVAMRQPTGRGRRPAGGRRLPVRRLTNLGRCPAMKPAIGRN
jgi:Protein of unknown function (DUF4065)